MSGHHKEAEMAPSPNVKFATGSTSGNASISKAVPPRDPDDDDEVKDAEDKEQNEDDEPAVIREPDE
jgi:hypothetical protein